MKQLSPRTSGLLLAIALLAVVIIGWPLGKLPQSWSADNAAAVADDAKLVELTIHIEDADSGLVVDAKRSVPAGTTAYDAMRMTVAIETKEFKGLGLFVTSLCGVKPAAGKFWSPSVDGKKSMAGIAQIKIEKATRLDWKTVDASK